MELFPFYYEAAAAMSVRKKTDAKLSFFPYKFEPSRTAPYVAYLWGSLSPYGFSIRLHMAPPISPSLPPYGRRSMHPCLIPPVPLYGMAKQDKAAKFFLPPEEESTIWRNEGRKE